MVIYRPAEQRPAQTELDRITTELAKCLLPAGKLLESRVEAGHVHFLIRSVSVLTSFELYARDLKPGAFEGILRTATELESKRKQQNDPDLNEINIYLFAHHFSDDFLEQLPSVLVEIRLFEWSSLHSKSGDAVLIREQKSRSVPSRVPSDGLAEERIIQRELNTPELIAFARFGMELRDRCLKVSRLS